MERPWWKSDRPRKKNPSRYIPPHLPDLSHQNTTLPERMRKARPGGTRAGRGGTGKYDHSFPTQFTILLSPSLLTTGPVNSENLSLALLEDQPDDLKDKTPFIQELFILADSAENKMWKSRAREQSFWRERGQSEITFPIASVATTIAGLNKYWQSHRAPPTHPGALRASRALMLSGRAVCYMTQGLSLQRKNGVSSVYTMFRFYPRKS